MFCRLSLSGKSLRARKPPVEARSNRQGVDAPITEFTHLEEEIFEQEGEYEEVIAIEYKDLYVVYVLKFKLHVFFNFFFTNAVIEKNLPKISFVVDMRKVPMIKSN